MQNAECRIQNGRLLILHSAFIILHSSFIILHSAFCICLHFIHRVEALLVRKHIALSLFGVNTTREAVAVYHIGSAPQTPPSQPHSLPFLHALLVIRNAEVRMQNAEFIILYSALCILHSSKQPQLRIPFDPLRLGHLGQNALHDSRIGVVFQRDVAAGVSGLQFGDRRVDAHQVGQETFS